MKQISSTLIGAALLFFATAAAAQLPQLTPSATLTGATTSAEFYGGATADEGSSYANSFAFDQAIDILAEIRVESAHVNTMGNLYIIIVWEGQFFMRDENGGYQIWDLNLASLLAASPAKTLQSVEPLTIVDDLAFGPIGVSNTSLAIYLAYDTMAANGELFFSGTPLTVAIEAEQTVAASFQLYTDTVSQPIIQTRCIVCHSDTGVASSTSSTPSQLQYVNSLVPDFQTINYNTLVNYINNGGGTTLLAKPSGGEAHTGAIQLNTQTQTYQDFEAFVNAVLAE